MWSELWFLPFLWYWWFLDELLDHFDLHWSTFVLILPLLVGLFFLIMPILIVLQFVVFAAMFASAPFVVLWRLSEKVITWARP